MKKDYKKMSFKCANANEFFDDISFKEVKGLFSRVKLGYTYMRGFKKSIVSVVDTIMSSMSNTHIYYLIKEKHKVIGSFCFKMSLNNDVELLSFSILPEYQNAGYGEKSIKNILMLCKNLKYDYLRLNVKSNNKVALKLYKNCGFS